MATMKYFSGDVELIYIHPMLNAKFAVMFPGVRGIRYDGYYMCVGYAHGATKDGNELPVTRKIEFKSNPSLHKCDARCQNAKGRICECSCGGKYHGFSFSNQSSYAVAA